MRSVDYCYAIGPDMGDPFVQVETFALRIRDQETWKSYAIACKGIPTADQAEEMFEALWAKCEKDKALV